MKFNPLAFAVEKISEALDKHLPIGSKAETQAIVPVSDSKEIAPVQTQAIVPASSDSKEATIVTGRFVESANELHTESTRQTEKFMAIVEKFDEDRQEPIEWLIRKFASLFCYVAPFTLAVPIGLSVGDAFTPQGSGVTFSFAIHALSVFLEIMMPILGLSAVISWKRAIKDRSKIGEAIAVSAFFFVISIGNALALLYLLESNGLQSINFASPAGIGIIGRSFGSLIIDVGSSVYLTVSGVKSLAKYLADQRAKIVAVKDVNSVHIEMEQTQIKAAIDRQTAIMDMQAKQQRSSTWNEIEKLQSQAMIDQAKRNMSGGSDGYRRSAW